MIQSLYTLPFLAHALLWLVRWPSLLWLVELLKTRYGHGKVIFHLHLGVKRSVASDILLLKCYFMYYEVLFSLKKVTFMHLPDAFMQSHLHYILRWLYSVMTQINTKASRDTTRQSGDEFKGIIHPKNEN